MNEPIFLFVGRSASGKTTIANLLEEKYGYKQVQSYTTRPPRYEGEVGHIFVTKEEFDALGELAAYTEYNGYKYGTTIEQLNSCTIYVVDIPGVKTLLERYKTNRQIVIIFFDTTVYTRINRMLNRGDSDIAIISRLLQDEKDNWFNQLDSLVWHYNNIIGTKVTFYSVNANNSQDDVEKLIMYYINQHQEI